MPPVAMIPHLRLKGAILNSVLVCWVAEVFAMHRLMREAQVPIQQTDPPCCLVFIFGREKMWQKLVRGVRFYVQ
jgi:hypothetical protein